MPGIGIGIGLAFGGFAPVATLPELPISSGLTGRYYANSDFAEPAAEVRVDGPLGWDNRYGNFDNDPDSGIPATGFSVRWKGSLVATTTGNYRIRLSARGAHKMILDGVIVGDSPGDFYGGDFEFLRWFEAGVAQSVEIEFASVFTSNSLSLLWRDETALIEGLRLIRRDEMTTMVAPVLVYESRMAGATIVASAGAQPNGGPQLLIDGLNEPAFLTQAQSHTLTITFPTSREIDAYRLTTAIDAPERDWRSWTMEFSNDGGATWAAFDSRAGQAWGGRSTSRTFGVETPVTCNTMRITANNDTGASYVGMAELAFRKLTGTS